MHINLLYLHNSDYADCLQLQTKIRELRSRDQIEDTLILTEHPPVLTMGVRGRDDNILTDKQTLQQMGIEIHHIKRGGDVTYHGPGQLVGYPIINLKQAALSIKGYLDKIQDVFIDLLRNEYQIDAHKELDEYAGVWVGNEKITAIGIQIAHMVTMHGFAYNVNTNMDHFKLINPCGLTDRNPTSLQQLTGGKVDMNLAAEQVVAYFAKVFEADIRKIELSEIQNV